MLTIPRRLQLELIAFSYAVLSLYATWQWHFRYLAELKNPIDSAGGMWAFGDLMLNGFLFGLFLVPTFFLLRLIARDDRPFAIYSKVAFAVALTAPLSGAVLAAIHPLPQWAENLLVDRLFSSPLVLLVLVLSRIFGRHHRLKRRLTGALAIEFLTIVGFVVVLFFTARAHQ